MANETQVINLEFVMGANATSLLSEVQKINTAMLTFRKSMQFAVHGAQDSFASFNQNFAKVMTQTGQFTVHMNNAQSSTVKFGKALNDNKLTFLQHVQAIREYTNAATRANSEIAKLADQQTRLANAKTHVIGQDAQGRVQTATFIPTGTDPSMYALRAAKANGILALSLENASRRLIDWGKNTQWAGRQLTVGLTVPIAAAIAGATMMAKTVEGELATIQKVYDFTSQDVAAQTKEWASVQAESMKMATKAAEDYGATLADTLNVEAQLAAAGKTVSNGLIGTTQEVVRATTLTFQGAAATAQDYQNVVDATISLQNIFKLNTKQTADAFNYMNAVENATVLKMRDFIDAIPRSFGPLHTLGLSLQDIGTLLTAMKANGVSAAQGSNALKSAMVSLLNPTTAAVKAFKEAGINLKDLVASTGGNLYQSLIKLSGLLSKMAPSQEESLLARLFGKYQMARIDAVVKGLRDVHDATTQVGRAYLVAQQSTQQWGDMAAKQIGRFQKSPYGEFQRATAKLQAQLVSLGETFFGLSTMIINFASKTLEWFNKLPEPVKKITEIIVASIAAIGPAIMLFGTIFGNLVGNMVNVVVRTVTFAYKKLFGSKIDMDNGLTPEMIAEREASKALTTSLYDQATAVDTLNGAIKQLLASYREMIVGQSNFASMDQFLSVGKFGKMVPYDVTKSDESGGTSFGAAVKRAFPGIVGGYGRRSTSDTAISQAAVMRPEDVMAGGVLTRSLSATDPRNTFVAANQETLRYFQAWENKLKEMSLQEVQSMTGISDILKKTLIQMKTMMESGAFGLQMGHFSHFTPPEDPNDKRYSPGLGFWESESSNKFRGAKPVTQSSVVAGAEEIFAAKLKMTAEQYAAAGEAAQALAAATIAGKIQIGEELIDFGKILEQDAELMQSEGGRLVAQFQRQLAAEQAAQEAAYAGRAAQSDLTVAQMEELTAAERAFTEATIAETKAAVADTEAKQEMAAVEMESIPANAIGQGRTGGLLGKISGKGAAIGGGVLAGSLLASQIPQNMLPGGAITQDALNGAGTGALTLGMLGPWGALAGGVGGGVIGAAVGWFSKLNAETEKLVESQKKAIDVAGSTVGSNLGPNALGFAGAKDTLGSTLKISFGGLSDAFQKQTDEFIQGVKSNFSDQISTIKDASDSAATNIGQQIYSELLLNGVPQQAAKNIVAQIYREAGKQKLVIPVTMSLDKVTSQKQVLDLIHTSTESQLNDLKNLARKDITYNVSVDQEIVPGTGSQSQYVPKVFSSYGDRFKKAMASAGTIAGKELFDNLQASIDKQTPASVANSLQKKMTEIIDFSFSTVGLDKLDDPSKNVLAKFGIDGSKSLDDVAASVLRLDNATRGKLYSALTQTGTEGANRFIQGMKSAEIGTDNVVKELDNLVPGLGDIVARFSQGATGATAYGIALNALTSDLHQFNAALDTSISTVQSQITGKALAVVAAMQKRFQANNNVDAEQARIDKREKAAADAITATKDAYEAQIKAIQDAEDAKQKAFQAEQERLRRQQEMHNLQVQLAEDIAGGNLFAANRDANNIEMTGKQNAATDAAAASQAAADARIKVLKNEEDKKTKLMQDAADKQKAADDAHMKEFKDNADKRAAAEATAEKKITDAAASAVSQINDIWAKQGIAGLAQIQSIAKQQGVAYASTLEAAVTSTLKDVPKNFMDALTKAITGADWIKMQQLVNAAMSLKNSKDLQDYVKLVAAGKIPVIKGGELVGIRGPNGGTVGFADGGQVQGPGTSRSDSIPAYLSRGEYVIQADAVDHYGKSTFDAMNAKRFAGGGPVTQISDNIAKWAVQAGVNSFIAGALAAASGTSSYKAGSGLGTFSPKRTAFLDFILGQNGDAYSQSHRLGPNSWDCSGLIWGGEHAAGLKIPPLTAEGLRKMDKTPGKPMIGDLAFFNHGSEKGRSIDHVAVWLGNNKIFAAMNPHAGVGYGSLSYEAGAGGKDFRGFGRIPGLSRGAMKINYDNTIANLHKGERVLTAPMTKNFDQALENLANGDNNMTLIVQVDKANATIEDIQAGVTKVLDLRDAKVGRKRTVTHK